MRVAIVVPSNLNCSPNKIVSYICSSIGHLVYIRVFYFKEAHSNALDFGCDSERLSLGGVWKLKSFDVVHSNLMRSDVLCSALAKFYDFNLLTTLHSDYIYDLSTHYKKGFKLCMLNAIWRFALNNIKVLVPVSESLGSVYRCYFPASYVYPIQNGYSGLLNGRTTYSEREYDLVIVSRLHPGKGIEDAIDVLKKNVQLKLLVVGEGGLFDVLVSRAEPVANQVTFRGYSSEPAIEYKKAKIMIMPSRNEGFGMTILESLHNGTPVICFDTSVNREILGDGPFFYKTIEQLDVLIKSMMANWDAMFHQQCQSVNKFTAERMSSKYLSLYRSMCSAGNDSWSVK